MRRPLLSLNQTVSRIFRGNKLERLLIYIAKAINVNLYPHALIQLGALASIDMQLNGEGFFIESILPAIIKEKESPIFFDVGANVGDYSLELEKYFPNANIHSFEPVESTFNILAKNISGHHINALNIGFSDQTGTGELFNTVNTSNNTIASAYKDTFPEIFDTHTPIESIQFQMETIDNFCHLNGIKIIDFLKIDVEGHELSVLQGAVNKLLDNDIKVIQFEFNAHNIYARVFLRDFYLVLKEFDLYRLSRYGMIRLGPYNTANEIFSLQNIVAIHKELSYRVNQFVK